MKNRNANHNHFVMTVEDTINNNREIANAYFDGTQAQATRFFKAHRLFKQYGSDSRYVVSFRGNSVILFEAQYHG